MQHRQPANRWVLLSRLLYAADRERHLGKRSELRTSYEKGPCHGDCCRRGRWPQEDQFTPAKLARTRIARPPPTNHSPAEHKVFKHLIEEESIVIAPADKGNLTVVMDLEEYDRKIRTLLADADTYKRPHPSPGKEDECHLLVSHEGRCYP